VILSQIEAIIHCLSSCPRISSRATPQWSSQDSAESGFLHDWSPASKIFLPWREKESTILLLLLKNIYMKKINCMEIPRLVLVSYFLFP